MKKNSKKILLFLYPSEKDIRWLPEETLKKVVPELSEAGFKSLLFLLEKKQYLISDKSKNEIHYALSSYGKSFLKELFPSLSIKSEQDKEDWAIIVFLSSPKTDKNFRFLRSFLTKNKAVSLTRAVFLIPSPLKENIKKELEASYRNSVLALKISEWLVGDEYTVMGQKAGLNDLHEQYSSISRELGALTAILIEKKDLTDRQKSTLFSAFSRFLDLLEIDTGILPIYFSQVEGSVKLLSEFQKTLEI